jgi:hypothetical protein
LWVLLPENVTKEISDVRSGLDASAVAFTWAVLSIVWVFWAWWAAPLGLLAAFVIYRGLLVAKAENYGALVEATFDLFRGCLYDALRWPLPESPSTERSSGLALSRFLAYGDPGCDVTYRDTNPQRSATKSGG